MAYTPTTWAPGPSGTEITTTRLNNIETGLDATDEALAQLLARISALNSGVAVGTILEIQNFATAAKRWPFPIVHAGVGGWPARSSVVPSWYTGPAQYEAYGAYDVTPPTDAIDGDILTDLYAA